MLSYLKPTIAQGTFGIHQCIHTTESQPYSNPPQANPGDKVTKSMMKIATPSNYVKNSNHEQRDPQPLVYGSCPRNIPSNIEEITICKTNKSYSFKKCVDLFLG